LISFDENYRMIFSPQLKEHYTNDAFKTQFLVFKGKRISFPKPCRSSRYLCVNCGQLTSQTSESLLGIRFVFEIG